MENNKTKKGKRRKRKIRNMKNTQKKINCCDVGMFLRTGSAEINQDALLNCSMLLVASEGLGVVALMLECHFSSLLKLDPPVEIGTPFFFPRTFFLALGLVGAVLLGSFQACAIYIPAAPDVQGNRAKSKPLLLRGGLGRGWRRGGGWLQPAPHW